MAKVFIGGEYSGQLRDAFIRHGHDAMSCDFFPTESPGPHFQGDMFSPWVLRQQWDLAVLHPTCTFVCNSGVKHLYKGGRKENGPCERRWNLMRAGAYTIKACLDFPAERLAVENPIIHGHALEIIGREQDQIVQPWWFGDPFLKATGWWLNGLDALVPTNKLTPPTDPAERRKWAACHRASPGPDRGKIRSEFYPGMADACAQQWGAPQKGSEE